MNSERIPSLHARLPPLPSRTVIHVSTQFPEQLHLVHGCRVAMTPWSATQAIGFTDAPPVALARVRQRLSFFRRFVSARCRVRLLHQANSVHGSPETSPAAADSERPACDWGRGRPCASRVQQLRPSLALEVDVSAADRLRRAGPPPGLCFFAFSTRSDSIGGRRSRARHARIGRRSEPSRSH